MTKHNKIRYARDNTPKKTITLSGNIWLLYADEEALQTPKVGDLMAFPKCDELNSTYMGMYDATGFSGYFKFDVWDGRDWCPVVLAELFPGREHYFSKTEMPIDTYALCREALEPLAGQKLTRTYREHYELVESAPEAD